MQRYADLVDELFCRPTAEFAGYRRLELPEVVVPGVMARVLLDPPDDPVVSELTIFEGIDGFAGDLWERSARTMLRMRPLQHSGLPVIAAAKYLTGRGIGFTLTRDPGRPVNLDEAAAWAADDPIEAFEQFSVLLDALRQMHAVRILHRGMLPGAFRYHPGGDSGPVRLSLSRFEMSALISNVIRRVVGSDAAEVRQIVRALYLTPDPGSGTGSPLDFARHLAYLAPEMHSYLFDDRTQSRRDWETTDIFGLGVFGWELFCGALPRVLPEELETVAAAPGQDRIEALATLNRAMRVHLSDKAAVPYGLKAVLRRMIDPKPGERGTSFELATHVEQGWDAIHIDWEAPAESPYLVAFMPEECVDTIYNERKWISRNPLDVAGQQQLKEFFEKELRAASLVHSITGARGYATGPDTALREAEWVLIGEQALWFCSLLREYRMGGEVERIIPQVLLIKYLKEHEFAPELFGAYPRRRLPMIDMMPFWPRQPLRESPEGRPSWEKLTESVRSRGPRDDKDEEFLKSLDFLLDYQRMVLDARTYPFILDSTGADGRYLLRFDDGRDDMWRHRSPLFTAYAQDPGRRPKMGDFFHRLANDALQGEAAPEDDPDWVMLQVDPRPDWPAFGRDVPVVQFIARRDQDTIEVRPRSGAKLPSRGWLRPKADSGTPSQLARQDRARQALQHQAATVRSLRDPVSYEVSRGYWRVDSLHSLDGNAPDVIRDMLALEPFYALQGPPGSGKTTAASHALGLYLSANRGARVLVSAQSNFALDNLAARLKGSIPPGMIMLREVAEGREPSSVSPEIQPHIAYQLTETLAREVEETLTSGNGAAAGAKLAGAQAAAPAGSQGAAPPGARPVPAAGVAELTDEDRRAAEGALAAEWLASVRGNQVELGERIRTGASVVVATCSIAATVTDGAPRLDEAFDWVIVEEAAKAWPTEVMIPLVLGHRWTLIGDHRQLGAHRGEEVARFLESLRSHPNPDIKRNYDERHDRLRVLNMFKALFEDQQTDSPAESGDSMYAKGRGRLNTQFRMHRDIAEPVRRVFYPREPRAIDRDGLPESFLESHPKATRDHGVTVPGILAGRALVWLDTAGYPGCVDRPTWSNEGEVDLVEKLVAMEPPAAPPGQEGDGSLVVLTPYRDQVRKLRQRGVLLDRVHTVHSFQGREADRVVVSLVRSTGVDGGPAANVGHVGQDEVANVLLSRARRLLVVVGNLEHFAANGGPKWHELARVVRRYGKVVVARDWDET